MLHYRHIWNEAQSQLFEKLTTEPKKGEDEYMHGKLKTWKQRIKRNFHNQDIPYDTYFNAIEVLKIGCL